jgi:hypothetical protein
MPSGKEIGKGAMKIRFFGYLAEQAKKDPSTEFELALPGELNLKDLFEGLGISEREILLVINPGKNERILMINNDSDFSKKIGLNHNDRVWIYPFLDGG